MNSSIFSVSPSHHLFRAEFASERITKRSKYLAEAQAKGIQVLEFEVTARVQVPVHRILSGTSTTLENVRFECHPQIESEIIRQINEKYPDLAKDIQFFCDMRAKLHGMFRWSNEDHRYVRTDSFDYDEAMRLINASEAIHEKFFCEKDVTKDTEEGRYHSQRDLVVPILDELKSKTVCT